MVLSEPGAVKLRGRALPAAMPKRDTAGRYWASFAVEEAIALVPPAPRPSIGIDLAHLTTLSTGEGGENPRHLQAHLARLERLHRLNHQLVHGHQVIAVEDLSTEGMGRSARGTREARGRTVVVVERWFPSSKRCGDRHERLRLADRRGRCSACEAEHDRDVNAARNLEAEGLRLLMHPEDTGSVRASGGEGGGPAGTAPGTMSARIDRTA